MTYMMKAWKNVEEGCDTQYKIRVCCRKLSKQDHIVKEDNWKCWSDDGECLFEYLKHCPFCGEELP